MALDCVRAQTDELDAALSKLWLKLCESAQLSCADRRIVFGVREEDDPAIADELATYLHC